MLSGGQMCEKKEAESVECSTLVKSLRDREKWILRDFLNRSSGPTKISTFFFVTKNNFEVSKKYIFQKILFSFKDLKVTLDLTTTCAKQVYTVYVLTR